MFTIWRKTCLRIFQRLDTSQNRALTKRCSKLIFTSRSFHEIRELTNEKSRSESMSQRHLVIVCILLKLIPLSQLGGTTQNNYNLTKMSQARLWTTKSSWISDEANQWYLWLMTLKSNSAQPASANEKNVNWIINVNFELDWFFTQRV